MDKHIFYTQKIKQYKGRYVAVRGNKIIASGENATEVFTVAQKVLGKKKKIEGLYYVPQEKDLFTALCVFLTTN